MATRFKEARLRAGLSQEAVARRAGVSSITVSRLERGVTKNPKTDELERIAGAVGTTVEALVAEDDQRVEDEASYVDLERRVQQATGNRKVAIGFARAIRNWNRYSEAQQQLLEAALEVLPDAPEGPEDISKTPL